jgi:hypothetical protein
MTLPAQPWYVRDITRTLTRARTLQDTLGYTKGITRTGWFSSMDSGEDRLDLASYIHRIGSELTDAP